MKRFLTLFLFGLAVVLLTLDMALGAEAPCGSRSDLVNRLASTYQQHQVYVGVLNEDTNMEVFVSDSGDFTIAATTENDMACLMIIGTGWTDINKVEGQPILWTR
jgi:hypothetical protein